MSRPLRIELAGGLYHVTAHGDRREDIYVDDDDRVAWLRLLGEVCDRFNWRCHAFCQMSNHYHLVVETPDANLARGMRQLNGVYTQTINHRHGCVGHTFQGRYKGILVEKEAYLLELARYVVLNPVRAHRVNDVADWPWSSYAAMFGTRANPAWLEVDWLLGQFADDRQKAIARYRDFVRAGVGLDGLWSDLKAQVFLGGEHFVERMQSGLPDKDRREVPRLQRRGSARPLLDYARTPHSREGMARAYRTGEYTMRQIADYFDVHYSTVSRAVKKFENTQS